MSASDESIEISKPAPKPLLVRISEVFGEISDEILAALGATGAKRLGSEYFLIPSADAETVRKSDAGKFVRFNLPVEHSWPCNPEKMDGFIEKAAQAMFKKFGSRKPQAILIGQLDPSVGNRYYKTLASNLRGRALQVFTTLEGGGKGAEDQHSDRDTLFCFVGKEGLFCGMQSPKKSNGFYPGGTKYISQGAEGTISRAGAKIAEALHYLRIFRSELGAGARWLELGASPGGMTSELLKRGYLVTAVDRAVLDVRLAKVKGLEFFREDVTQFVPKPGAAFEGMLCDMNNDPREAIRQVARLSPFVKPGGVLIFTLKTTAAKSVSEINALYQDALAIAAKAGLKLFAQTHLTYNRQEFTLFLERTGREK